MKLTHAGDDRLTGFFIGIGFERRVFLGELRQCDAHLLLTCLRLRLDGHADNRLGEFHRLEDDRMVHVAERIAGRRVLQTHDGGDVAGIDAVDVLAVVCVHQQDAAHTLTDIFVGVEHRFAGFQLAGIDPEECQLSYERVSHNLECKRCERLIIR